MVTSLCRHQLDFSIFNELCVFLSLGMGPFCHFSGEKPIVLVIVLGCLGIPVGPLANNSIKCNSILVLEASFGDTRWLVGTLSPPLFGDFI